MAFLSHARMGVDVRERSQSKIFDDARGVKKKSRNEHTLLRYYKDSEKNGKGVWEGRKIYNSVVNILSRGSLYIEEQSQEEMAF